MAGPLLIAWARARRRGKRWVLPILGLTVAAGFAGAIAVESTVASDQQARAVLSRLTPLERAVRISWAGAATPTGPDLAARTLGSLGLGAQTQVVLLNPVRLSGVVVRPAGILPLARWSRSARASGLPPCRAVMCPMLATSSSLPAQLTAPGVRITLAGPAALGSAVPLGFAPRAGAGTPVVVTGDPAGLAGLPALSSMYRTYGRVAVLPTESLHSWALADLARRLVRIQAELAANQSPFSLTAPFAALQSAQREASATSDRLLLAGGGAAVALGFFLALAFAGLRQGQRAEMRRLGTTGATLPQAAMFALVETGWLAAVGLALGFGSAVLAGVGLASSAGEPVGAILSHSLLTGTAGLAAAGIWLASLAFNALVLLPGSGRVADAGALAAAALLGAGLASSNSASGAWSFLVAPLCCLAAGIVVVRLTGRVLRRAQRLAWHGPVSARLAVVGLARRPELPSVAIAFLAISLGLGGFALAYRATLSRAADDQAADVIPLDARVAPGPDFATPSDLRPLAWWRRVSRGTVLPVRRAEASYPNGERTVTVPVLGVPAAGLRQIHGWRSSDGSAPLTVLARRLAPPGPARAPGPRLPAAARRLTLAIDSPALDLGVIAELRDSEGRLRPVTLIRSPHLRGSLTASLPGGRWEVAALELREPTGLEATAGHQNAENPAATTQFATRVGLGPLRISDLRGHILLRIGLGSWRGVGAAAVLAGPVPAGSAQLRFNANAAVGVLRPVQPSDALPIPVLTDPGTAAAAGPGGKLALSVDALPVQAQVVGTVRRFPTVDAGAAGIVVADEDHLDAALEAQLPGQGQPDELWIASTHTQALRTALAKPPLSELSASFRSDVQNRLSSQSVARSLRGTLLAAALIGGALAVLGLLLVLAGPLRDRKIEEDLCAQGFGPRALRAELFRRLTLAVGLAVVPGAVMSLLLERLALSAAGAVTLSETPQPPPIAVFPWLDLSAWTAVVVVLVLAAGWLLTRVVP